MATLGKERPLSVLQCVLSQEALLPQGQQQQQHTGFFRRNAFQPDSHRLDEFGLGGGEWGGMIHGEGGKE